MILCVLLASWAPTICARAVAVLAHATGVADVYSVSEAGEYVMPMKRLDTHGHTWFAVKPEDPTSWRETKWRYEAYDLEYRVSRAGHEPDTGWHLYGEGFFGNFMARRLIDAINKAGNLIK